MTGFVWCKTLYDIYPHTVGIVELVKEKLDITQITRRESKGHNQETDTQLYFLIIFFHPFHAKLQKCYLKSTLKATYQRSDITLF